MRATAGRWTLMFTHGLTDRWRRWRGATVYPEIEDGISRGRAFAARRERRARRERFPRSPSVALGIAAALVLSAFVVGIMPVGFGVRWEAAGVWIAVIGVAAAVTAIYAAYLEIGLRFPQQRLTLWPVSYGKTSGGYAAPCILFVNAEGDPVIERYILEITLVDGEVDISWSDAPGWEPTPDPNPRASNTWRLTSKSPLFPGSTIAGPFWAPRTDTTVVWDVRWHTDRGQGGAERLTFPPGYDH